MSYYSISKFITILKENQNKNNHMNNDRWFKFAMLNIDLCLHLLSTLFHSRLCN